MPKARMAVHFARGESGTPSSVPIPPHPSCPTVIAVLDGNSEARAPLARELAAALARHRQRKVSLVTLGGRGVDWGCPADCSESLFEPLREGLDTRPRPPAPAGLRGGGDRSDKSTDIVIVEGNGNEGWMLLSPPDALIWLDDGEVGEYSLLGTSHPPQVTPMAVPDSIRPPAQIRVSSGRGYLQDENATARTVDALADLPGLTDLLAPARAERESVRPVVRRIFATTDPEALFQALYADAPYAVWLDSADAGTGSRSRFSIMADDSGLLGRRMVHRGGQTEVVLGPGTTSPVTVRTELPFFTWLDSAWETFQSVTVPGLDCGFALGWLGYLGYELKRECGGSDTDSGIPDAQLVYAARAVVLDHELGEVWLLALESPDAASWLDTAERAARSCPTRVVSSRTTDLSTPSSPIFTARDNASRYKGKVRAALAEIREGNTYEVCLTTALESTLSSFNPLAAYHELRRRSPAPFAAFARFGVLTVASSSPERFLSVDAHGAVRAEPIKGTRRRSPADDPDTDERMRSELAANPKDRAENLMIVDLLRNDLSRFAIPGSVSVSRLFDVETYATVHQLVSTIDARLLPGASRAGAVAAAFPPGSMTGAPKTSTMEFLDCLEAGTRGVYAGAIGYFSRTGAADLSVVIRTLVSVQGSGATKLTIGVGGAIISDSDPEAEHDEIRAKAVGVLSALGAVFPQ